MKAPLSEQSRHSSGANLSPGQKEARNQMRCQASCRNKNRRHPILKERNLLPAIRSCRNSSHPRHPFSMPKSAMSDQQAYQEDRFSSNLRQVPEQTPQMQLVQRMPADLIFPTFRRPQELLPVRLHMRRQKDSLQIFSFFSSRGIPKKILFAMNFSKRMLQL